VAEPLVRYDPVAAERLLFAQPAKWLVRNVQIALPLGLWVAGIVFDVATGVEVPNRTRRARELNSIIASLGPAIISESVWRRYFFFSPDLVFLILHSQYPFITPSVIFYPQPISHAYRARAEAGQALASRPDLLPGEYLEELQKLQDDVPTFGNDIAFRIVEEELKQKFVDVFELIEPEPVAGTCHFRVTMCIYIPDIENYAD
jgi:aarF domain-containing kinase